MGHDPERTQPHCESVEVERLICDIVLTMPEDQRKVFMNQIVHGNVHFEIKVNRDSGALRKKNTDGLWMPTEDVNFIIQVAMEHCQFCPCSSVQDQRACEFGKLLDRYFVDKTDPDGCGYASLAGLVRGVIDGE